MPVILTPGDRTELGLALATIPGLPELVAQADTVRRQTIPQPATSQDGVIAAARDQLRKGQPVDVTEVGAQLADAAHQLDVAERAHAARRLLVGSLDREAEQLIESNVDVALAALAASLADLLDLARAIEDVIGGLDEAQILRSGTPAQLQAWRDLAGLATRYSEIRSAQTRLVALVWTEGNHGEAVRRFGWLRGMDRIWNRDQLPAMPPWPHQPNTTQPEEPAVGPALIRWLVTHPGADPWVPSIEQLHTEAAEAGQRDQERNPPAPLDPEMAAFKADRQRRYAAYGAVRG